MTEEEWLACRDPVQMLFGFDSLKRLPSDRKLFLFSIACWTRVCALLSREDQHVLTRVEDYVEGTVTRADLEACLDPSAPFYRGPSPWSASSLRSLLPSPDESRYVAESTVVDTANLAGMNSTDPKGGFDAEQKQQIALLHDIFRNPFRKTPKMPKAWRTSTAVALARQMYESRDFGAMPILADALQDAGCDNEDVLSHCRDPKQVHVRGCWLVDLVLGKE